MITTDMLAWAVLNAGFSVAVFVVCFCRVTASSKKVLKRVRAKFTLLGTSFALYGFSPFWGHYPGAVGCFVSFATFVGLLAETYQWGKGPPESVKFQSVEKEQSWTSRLISPAKSSPRLTLLRVAASTIILRLASILSWFARRK